MEINKLWVKFITQLWILAGILAIFLVGVGFFWSKSTDYFKQIWPSFIGTCFGVVFSAGFAGLLLIWQMKRDENTRKLDLKNTAVQSLKEWEGELMVLLSSTDIKGPNYLRINSAKVKNALAKLNSHGESLKIEINNIPGNDLMPKLIKLNESISNCIKDLDTPLWEWEKIKNSINEIQINFKELQSATHDLVKS
jgi:hypothetical protein